MTGDAPDRSSNDDADSLLREIAAAPDRVPEAAPERVAQFRILGRLGRGGMGVVYRAEDETLRRMVALKLLPNATGDDEQRQRFLREARSAAAIAHPNVAVVHQVGEAEGRIYIAMELVEGENLRARLGRGRLGVSTSREVALQIARGLSAAHEKGIVHRDLKPENVMITPAGVVKILDFGLAKTGADRGASAATVAALAKTETRVTSDAGRIMGTPEYMSPEQALGEAVDVRSDVFSFGILFYEMLAGARPFAGASTGAVLVAIARDAVPPLRARAPDVDDATDAIVTRCLAKAPGERFDGAGEIVKALTRGAAKTTESRTDVAPLTHDDARPARSSTARYAIALAATIALVTGGGAWLAHRANPSAAVPPIAADAAPAATTMTDHPPPKTNSPEAATEYTTAMQAFRDAAMSVANDKLSRATKLDPNFAAAQLRLILYNNPMTPAAAQRRFAAASQNRASLSERDRDLLGVAEPAALPDDPDQKESARRAQAVAKRWPTDAEVALIAGMRLGFAGDFPAAFAELDRALALDDRFALALHERAMFQGDDGDADGVLATTDRCLAISPTAAACSRRRAEVFSHRGQCAELEREARRGIAGEPNGENAYGYLSEALAAKRAPVETVRDAIERKLSFEDDPALRAIASADEERRLAMYTGDIGAAITHALETDRLQRAKDPGYHDLTTAMIYDEEIGERAKAVQLATEYLRHHDDFDGNSAFALAELRLAGRIDDADLTHRRDVMLQRARAMSEPSTWIYFYALLATTPDQARDAIAALPRFPPLPRSIGGLGEWTDREEPVGRTYLLAGDLDEAIAHLRVITRSCGVLTNLILYIRAHEELGEALAAKGDTAGACTELGVVLSYWGSAKPRSITADRAREAMRRSGCAAK